MSRQREALLGLHANGKLLHELRFPVARFRLQPLSEPSEPQRDFAHGRLAIAASRDRRQLGDMKAVLLRKREKAKDVLLRFESSHQIGDELGGKISPAAPAGQKTIETIPGGKAYPIQ